MTFSLPFQSLLISWFLLFHLLTFCFFLFSCLVLCCVSSYDFLFHWVPVVCFLHSKISSHSFSYSMDFFFRCLCLFPIGIFNGKITYLSIALASVFIFYTGRWSDGTKWAAICTVLEIKGTPQHKGYCTSYPKKLQN